VKVTVSDLRANVLGGVAKLGYPNEDAQIISEVHMYAQLRGNNQGITKIATGGVPRASEIAKYHVVKQNKCSALVSGGHSMVATNHAAKLAVQLATEHGVGIVGSIGSMSSSGAIGYFSRQIAEAGYIGLVCRGTPPFVAPFGSSEPKLGTNPLSYAFPTSERPIVFDIATSIIAGLGVVEAVLKGETLPEGIAYDQNRHPTTDPAQVWPKGSITTFGEHKGFGLSLLIQLLGGPFMGTSFTGLTSENGPGTFVMAIDPGLLIDKAEFLRGTNALVEQVRSAKPLPGHRNVQLPGERGDRLAKQAAETGEIEIAEAIWTKLLAFNKTS
jgi:LDH2 family malate/lactate/ureidoglycolate dehydrogenase